MVELDKPITMANYVFILLSTMMTSIAFNHVILEALTKKGKCPAPKTEEIPNKEIYELYELKLKIEEKVKEMAQLITASNAICPNNDNNKIDKLNARTEVLTKKGEYDKLLSDYTNITKKNSNLQKIFKFKYLNEAEEIPLNTDYKCEGNENVFFESKVTTLYDELKDENDESGCNKPIEIPTKEPEVKEKEKEKDSENDNVKFTNTSFEGFGDDDKYELDNKTGEKGSLKKSTYTKQITNGSIAVYIFSVLISIAGFIFHTHAYHIMGAIMNMIIAAMGLHLWTIYHDKENSVEDIDVYYMNSLISASWALCILTFTVFIFVYLNEESAY